MLNSETTVREPAKGTCESCGSTERQIEAVVGVNPGAPQDGRLRLHDTHVAVVTSCLECSETLKVQTFEDFLAGVAAGLHSAPTCV